MNKKILYYECPKTHCEVRCGGRVSVNAYETIKVPLEELVCPRCSYGTWAEMVPVYEEELTTGPLNCMNPKCPKHKPDAIHCCCVRCIGDIEEVTDE